jgi:hypothetical protein
VAGLARKLNESQTLQLEFERLINSNKTQRRTLTRRVSTRWNTDFAALQSHVMFQKEVLQLVAANPTLRKYALTEKQWVLAKHLANILVVGPATRSYKKVLTRLSNFRSSTKSQLSFRVPMYHLFTKWCQCSSSLKSD